MEVRGHSLAVRRVVCAYPPNLVDKLVNLSLHMAINMHTRGKIGPEGNYNHCAECDGGDGDGTLVCCDTCPRTFHRECMVQSARNRERAQPGRFHCAVCEFLSPLTDLVGDE